MVPEWVLLGTEASTRLLTHYASSANLMNGASLPAIHSSVAQWQSIRLLTEGL